MRLLHVGLSALLLTVFMATPATASEEASYIAPGGDALYLCPSPDLPCAGGSGFEVPSDADMATVEIYDDVFTTQVAAYAIFEDASGAFLSEGPICGGSDLLTVPAGATTLNVFISTAAGVLDCTLTDLQVYGATSGTIEVGFS